MKTDYKYKTIKIRSIVGTYYSCGHKTDSILVWAIGGPTVPDNGGLLASKLILNRGIDVFVPDYLGFGRSDGLFTPKNCIKTLLLCFKYFKKGINALVPYDSTRIHLKYLRVLFVGKSLGGAYVPLLPRFNKGITEIGIFCGAVDQSKQGSVKGEETNEDFIRTIEQGGYKYLYRGFLKNKKVWWKHLNDLDGLSPMDNIMCLKKVKFFIAHGLKDETVHFSKAVKYFQAINTHFPKNDNFKLKLYKNGDHGKSTTSPATKDFLDWIGVRTNRFLGSGNVVK